jgi:hypothetical protein
MLTVPAFEGADDTGVIGENNVCPQPCADELTKDVSDRFEPWKIAM